MSKPSRSFVINVSLLILGLVFPLILIFTFLKNPQEPLIFPRPFAMVIDDMGWNQGSSLESINGPYRLNLDRKMDTKYYYPIVDIAKELGIRFQGSFILGEMDRENICARYPTTTWMGKHWDNSVNIDSSQIRTMNYLVKNTAFLEFGMHGIGHEYWDSGRRVRAEYYNTEDRHPWPEDTLRGHFECFRKIMAQYGLSRENGHSFPESFVPTAHSYYWNTGNGYSLGEILKDNGVKYVNLKLDLIRYQNPPDTYGGGFDHGVHIIDRDKYGLKWDALNARPSDDIYNFTTYPVESHWTNYLSLNDSTQHRTTATWIDYLSKIQSSRGFYLAKNTEQLHSQWLYKHYTTISKKKNGKYIIDNRKMPDEAYENNGSPGNMVLAVEFDKAGEIPLLILDSKSIRTFHDVNGYRHYYLPPLEQKLYTLELKKQHAPMQTYLDIAGTYNIYDFSAGEDKLKFEIKMYGTQILKINCPETVSIISDNPHLKILGHNYNEDYEVLELELSGRDIQGERGWINILFE